MFAPCAAFVVASSLVAAEPLIKGWADEMTAKGKDGPALVEEARALIEKHSAGM